MVVQRATVPLDLYELDIWKTRQFGHKCKLHCDGVVIQFSVDGSQVRQKSGTSLYAVSGVSAVSTLGCG